MKSILLALLLCSTSLAAAAQSNSESLLVGPGDQLRIQVLDTPELEQHPRVTDAGNIPVTGIGSVSVVGLTPLAAAERIQQGMIAAHFMNHPMVVVTVDQYATQTISVLGEVKTPGTYSITAPRSILDAVALAGGLNGTADRHITVQHRNRTSTPVTYNLSNDSDEAIRNQVAVYPGDVILVPRAGLVYVLGDVARPGGFIMQNNHSQLTALQAIALAGGTHTSAVPANARLIRKAAGGGFTETAMNFSRMQKGQQADLLLQPDDVIYIPFSYIRNIDSNSSGIVASAASASVYAIP